MQIEKNTTFSSSSHHYNTSRKSDFIYPRQITPHNLLNQSHFMLISHTQVTKLIDVTHLCLGLGNLSFLYDAVIYLLNLKRLKYNTVERLMQTWIVHSIFSYFKYRNVHLVKKKIWLAPTDWIQDLNYGLHSHKFILIIKVNCANWCFLFLVNWLADNVVILN